MKQYMEILKKSTLFENIEENQLNAMLSCLGGRLQSYHKNEIIVAEGEAAKYVGIVLNGEVQIVGNDYYGNRSIVTNVEPSQLFGETFACGGVETMPLDVIASKETEVLLIDCRRIVTSCCNACSFHSQMVFNLMKVMAVKNLMFYQKVEITSKRTTREKLMTYLYFQAKKSGSKSFYIPYDRQGLADFLEVERSGLSSEIGKLQREGVFENKKNYFKLLQ